MKLIKNPRRTPNKPPSNRLKKPIPLLSNPPRIKRFTNKPKMKVITNNIKKLKQSASGEIVSPPENTPATEEENMLATRKDTTQRRIASTSRKKPRANPPKMDNNK